MGWHDMLPSVHFGSAADWPEMERLAYLDWRDSVIDTADTHEVIVVPTWNDLHGEGREDLHPEFSSPDGIHFNEAGQRHLAELFHRYDHFTE
jgi:lysophospholipase L1-like esterase